MSRKHVAIVSTGGTIAMVQTPGEDGVVPELASSELVAAVPGLSDVAQISTHDFSRIGSANLSFDSLAALADYLRQLAEGGDVDGIVVTQGTDTMEESAFFLDLVLGLDCPVAVTGAMRHPGLSAPDGPGNLMDAVRLVSHGDCPTGRVLVVMNGAAHDAAFVQKAHTSSVEAFVSPECGPMARIEQDAVAFSRALPARRVFSLAGRAWPRVAFHTVLLSEPVDALDRVTVDADALVLAALGGGHVPEFMVQQLEEMAKRMPVVLGSRTGAGAVLKDTYAYPGAEIDLLSRGLIHGGVLHPRKLRILLTVALAAGCSGSDLLPLIAAYS